MNAPVDLHAMSAEAPDVVDIRTTRDRQGGRDPRGGISRRGGQRPTLRILGVRGVPAQHGGFETFAENLSLYLVGKGWDVIVYCQDERGTEQREDLWRGVRRIMIPSAPGSRGSISFDWKAVGHAARHQDLCLTLGYNTAVFCWRLRLAGVKNVINMDGIEWARGKWGPVSRLWFYLNDWAGCWLGDHLVADHPAIGEHLASRGVGKRITMIPYGAEELRDAVPSVLAKYDLTPGRYFIAIARPEPENSILEMVKGYSAAKRDRPLVLLGNFSDDNAYHRAVKAAAGPDVKFLGAIYDKTIVQALRVHCTAYLHGHQVGGTNPSLVEALGAGNPVIAHDNRFNRWVAGPGAMYFADAQQFGTRLDEIVASPARQSEMRAASRTRFHEQFTFERVHREYEAMLRRWVRV